MILDIEAKFHELVISHFNKEGKIDYIRFPLDKEDRFSWEVCRPDDKNKDPEFSTWDGKPVKKVWLSDRERVNKYRIEEILLKYSDLAAPLYEFNMPKKYFIDIEVEVLDGFPDAETAQNKVTAIAIAGADSKMIRVMGLKDLDDKQCIEIERDINKHFEKFNEKWNFQYIKYESEFDMLYEFFNKLLPQFPCITGWNFTGYDWKYLLNRAERIKNVKPENCSPAKKLLGKNRYPLHRLVVDYMEIYKKWDRVIKVRENDKLDYVGKMAVGIEKIKYPGSFKDLYEKDFQKFVFYNAVDSILVNYIDKRLNTMLTYMKLAHVSGVEVKKAFSPIHIMEALMCREFLKDKKVFISGGMDDSLDQVPFEGAYVKEPVKGFHEWVTCYDFASLYPNTMMQYNISPETYVGTNVEPKEGEVKVGENHAEDGTVKWRVFKNTEDSVLRKILKDLYSKRKSTKQKYLSVNKEIDALERFYKQTNN